MPDVSLLDTEMKTYEQHRDHLIAEHEGKYVLIHKDQVAGTFHCEMDAIDQGSRQFGHVPFLVKQIVKVETPVFLYSPYLAI
jgi:hypothetical protein